jgi:hypothetical protein
MIDNRICAIALAAFATISRSPPPGMCRRTQWLARAPPMPSDASGSFRAAGLGPVAGRPVSAQASGTLLL